MAAGRSRGGGGGGDKPAGAPLWMVSFADMMTTLMAFFVLLYSMSMVDVTKFQEVVISLNGAFGVLSGGPGVLYLADLPTNIPPGDERVPTQITPLYVIREKYAKQIEMLAVDGRIETEITDQGLKLRFTDRTLFAPGSAQLRPDAGEVLGLVADMLLEVPNRVAIEGHTDSTPINTAQFPSNWELSTARATAVVHYFIENEGITPHRLTAAGYGEYWPLVPNDTPERRAYNRRVEIMILAEEEHKTVEVPTGQSGEETIVVPESLPDDKPQVDLLALPPEVAQGAATADGP